MAGGVLLGKSGIMASKASKKTRDMSKPAAFFAYVGCRTTKERNARGEGINVYRVDASTGRWDHLQLLKGLPNPSYLAFDRTRQFLYSVHGDSSDISAHRIDAESGQLTLVNQATTAGKNPVHLVVDPTNSFIVVANHITSTVVSIARSADGSIGSVVDSVTLTGKIGPHRVEQPFAKPHQVEFDRSERYIAVPDKGLDQVFTFELNSQSGKLTQVAAEAPHSREGSGPRHIVFHPSNAFAYVVDELTSTVTAHRFDAKTGSLAPFQVISTLPDSFVGDSRAGEIGISPDGKFVYASNRGADSIVTYAVDAKRGRLTPQGWTASGGKTPRFFAIDPSGRFLFAANEDSDEIAAFRLDAMRGSLVATGESVKTGSPVCIVFAPAAA